MFETLLRGSLDDIKTAVCVNGRMGKYNVNVWTEKWTVKNITCHYGRL